MSSLSLLQLRAWSVTLDTSMRLHSVTHELNAQLSSFQHDLACTHATYTSRREVGGGVPYALSYFRTDTVYIDAERTIVKTIDAYRVP